MELGYIADGYVVVEGKQLGSLRVEIVSVSSERPAIEGELQANVRMQNTGKYPIHIPWSTDPNITEKSQDPEHVMWDVGTFDVYLRGQRPTDVLLESLSSPLLGASFVKGSELTVQPGQWIMAAIRFKCEPQYAFVPRGWKGGNSELYVEWDQNGRSRNIKVCKVDTGYYRYGYRQQNPKFKIKLSRPH